MKVTIVGSGYVGLVTGTCLAALGHTVTCVDEDRWRVQAIARGEPPLREPGLADLLRAVVDGGHLTATHVLDTAIQASDVSILAVGTPATPAGIDLGAVATAAGAVGRALRAHPGYHVVVVKSTVVPGTTDTLIGPLIEDNSARAVGQFGLCVNPEFLREGSAIGDFMHPDRIVIGGNDERAAAVVASLYAGMVRPPFVMTTMRNAEMIKYTANALLATLISFSNEIAALCETVSGLDEETVMSAVHLDRRLTPTDDSGPGAPGILDYLRAGIGFGGSCLPKDVNALRRFAGERMVGTPLLDAAMAVNGERPRQVVGLLETVLGDAFGRTVAILGLTFKPGTDDVRASPALALVRQLRAAGALVRAWDPVVGTGAMLGEDVELAPDARTALDGADAAVIATAWPELRALDWDALTRRMRRPIVLDGRGALATIQLPAHVTYLRVGVRPERPAGASGPDPSQTWTRSSSS